MNSRTVLIDPEVDARWDSFVTEHPFGWFYHLSTWKRILEQSFPQMKGYYISLSDNGVIRAALPVYLVRSWLTGNRFVSVPYATLFDPLISSRDDMAELFKGILDLSKTLKTDYWEIRTFLSHSLIGKNGLGSTSYYKHHYLDLDQDLEQIKKKSDRTCVRQRITRAYKSELVLHKGSSTDDLNRFYKLYVMTRKRLARPPQPYRMFLSIWNTLSSTGRMNLLLAEHNDRTIGGVLNFQFKDRVSIEFAVHDEQYRDKSPIHFLFWESIKMAKAGGYRVIDFGRTSADNHGLLDFKRRWGAYEVDLPEYYYPSQFTPNYENQELSLKYKAIKKVCSISPDSLLPMIGSFCYRHLG